MHCAVALALAIMLSVAGSASSDTISGSEFKSGNWAGAAFTSDHDGRFSHCVISADYQTGDRLFFSVNRQVTVSLGVASPGINDLPVGYQFPVQVRVDRRAPFFGTARVIGEGFAHLEITDFDRALEAFKKGYTLVVDGAGRRGTYDLTGTFRALEAARQCAARYYDFVGNNLPPARTPSDKTEMFQLASIVISELGLKSFRFLNHQELAERGWENAVAWASPETGVSGLVLIMARNNIDDLRLTDAADTQFMANRCLGDYATSSRAVDLDGGLSAGRELRLVCEGEDKTTEIFLSKFFSRESVVYTMLEFDGDVVAQDNLNRQEWSETATLRAANYMLDP